MSNHEDIVAIDNNHINLIYSIVISHKPKNCLEIGIGTGRTTEQIISGFEYNNIDIDIDCVDNFYDWKGNCPDHIKKLHDNKFINLIVSSEYEYIKQCNKKYDLIISDGDHFETNLWFDDTMNILNDKGIVIYHDITNDIFPNLGDIIKYAAKYNHMLFNKNSRHDERCDRGLIVIQK